MIYKYITFSVGLLLRKEENKINCNIWWLIVQSRARTKVRERDNTTHDILWSERSDIFLHKQTQNIQRKTAFLLERKRATRESKAANPSTREHSKFERETECLCLNTAHSGGYFVQRTESLLKKTEINKAYQRKEGKQISHLLNFVNYLSKRKIKQ